MTKQQARIFGRAAICAVVAMLATTIFPPTARTQQQTAQVTLDGWAFLPARTFRLNSPVSGQFGDRGQPVQANGVFGPFEGQPIQGFSSVLLGPKRDRFYAVSDNGFGAKTNSADFVLGFHEIAVDFRMKREGAGTMRSLKFTALRDPKKLVPFPIVADGANYPTTADDTRELPVDAAIRGGRLLTGADFDVESFRMSRDGTFWFGDEFGPFLLHTDANGVLLDAPFALPGVSSPQNPQTGTNSPNLGPSRGFEGMALSHDGKFLYTLLEGGVAGDPPGLLRINEFDLKTKSFTARRLFYPLSEPTGRFIGEITAVNATQFLVIERDGGQGDTAMFKRIFLADIARGASDGQTVRKTELVDLLNIADPDDLDKDGKTTFRFPFQTIESVVILDSRTIGVVNDNNFPFSSGRAVGEPEGTEFALLRLRRPLLLNPPLPED